MHPPLVNVWRLSPNSRKLTNIYIRDPFQRYTDTATNQKESKTVSVESAYSFLSRVDTTRKQVPIANVDELDALRRQKVDHNHATVVYMKAFLNDHVQTIRGKDTLVMPPFCVFYAHDFGRGRFGRRLVTIVNIAWYDGVATQVTLLGEQFNVKGVRMVRVFTTEGEFLDAYLGEIENQEKSIQYAEEEREAEERYQKKEKDLDENDYFGYIGDTLVPTSKILGEILGEQRKKHKKTRGTTT